MWYTRASGMLAGFRKSEVVETPSALSAPPIATARGIRDLPEVVGLLGGRRHRIAVREPGSAQKGEEGAPGGKPDCRAGRAHRRDLNSGDRCTTTFPRRRGDNRSHLDPPASDRFTHMFRERRGVVVS